MSEYPYWSRPSGLKRRNSDQMVPRMSYADVSITAFDEPDGASQTMSFEQAVRIIERRRLEALGHRVL